MTPFYFLTNETAVENCLKKKKVNRKVQGTPQSQTAANPRHQEEEKKEKTEC